MVSKINRLPTFSEITVKVKASGGFTFINPNAARPHDGHPLLDERGMSYTDKDGKVLLFRRETLPLGWTGTIPKTPEVEMGLNQTVKVGKRNRVDETADTVTILVEVENQKKESRSSAFGSRTGSGDKEKGKTKDKGGA